MAEPVKQSFLYKDGKAELFLESEVEEKLADGWCDNPADAKNAVALAPEPSAPAAIEPPVMPVQAVSEAQPKRKRRTKAEMDAAKAAENPCQPAQTL